MPGQERHGRCCGFRAVSPSCCEPVERSGRGQGEGGGGKGTSGQMTAVHFNDSLRDWLSRLLRVLACKKATFSFCLRRN